MVGKRAKNNEVRRSCRREYDRLRECWSERCKSGFVSGWRKRQATVRRRCSNRRRQTAGERETGEEKDEYVNALPSWLEDRSDNNE